MSDAQLTYQQSMDAHAKDYLTRVLTAAGGERQLAAEMAGLNRTHLQTLLKRFGVEIPMNPRARGRMKCSKCTEKRESKGGKMTPQGFICATCITGHEAPKTQTANDRIRF